MRAAATAQAEFALCWRPRSAGWTRCADLLTPTALADWAGGLSAWLTHEYGEAPARTVAGYLLSWYLTVPARTAALLFHTARRVPRIDPASLAIRFDGPRPVEVAVLAADFACLANDPAADLPDATPLPDEAVLGAVLRGRYAAHAARFLTVLAPVLTDVLDVRLGRRTLWGTATDALDGACWRMGQALRETAAGAVDAGLVLPTVVPPFTAGSTMRLDCAGEWTRRRESCCFHYVLARGMGPCATCPRVCDR